MPLGFRIGIEFVTESETAASSIVFGPESATQTQETMGDNKNRVDNDHSGDGNDDDRNTDRELRSLPTRAKTALLSSIVTTPCIGRRLCDHCRFSDGRKPSVLGKNMGCIRSIDRQ